MTPFHIEENYIFKFVPFSLNTLKLLIKGELWFGYPHNLNDPFEGEFHLGEFDNPPNDEAIAGFYRNLLNVPESRIDRSKFKEKFKEDLYNFIIDRLKIDFGVSCFTDNPYNILMWSHYAESHKGICLVFDRELLLNSLQETYPNIKLDKINYCSSLLDVKPIYAGDKVFFTNDSKVLLQKLDDWKSENEIRLHIQYDSDQQLRTIPFERKSLKGIIIGEKMEKDNLATIIHLIHNSSYDIKWGQAKKNLITKKMEIHSCHLGIIDKINVERKK